MLSRVSRTYPHWGERSLPCQLIQSPGLASQQPHLLPSHLPSSSEKHGGGGAFPLSDSFGLRCLLTISPAVTRRQPLSLWDLKVPEWDIRVWVGEGWQSGVHRLRPVEWATWTQIPFILSLITLSVFLRTWGLPTRNERGPPLVLRAPVTKPLTRVHGQGEDPG